MPNDLILSGAKFSPCRTWRYALWRIWGHDGTRVVFIGLNPSTADENLDDPTVRRCIGFARDWGFDGMYMLNLFAFRATLPKDLRAAADPVGPESDQALDFYTRNAQLTVAAWGVHGEFRDRGSIVYHQLKCELKCFGTTKAGFPKHPLYLPKAAKLVSL